MADNRFGGNVTAHDVVIFIIAEDFDGKYIFPSEVVISGNGIPCVASAWREHDIYRGVPILKC